MKAPHTHPSARLARRTVTVLTVLVTTAAVSASQIPSAPKNLTIVAGGATDDPPLPRPVDTDPPPPSDISVRSGHPRMHFTPETLPAWRSWLAGPLRAQWQAYVNATGNLLSKTQEPVNADVNALIWLARNVPGVDYKGRSPETFAATAVTLIRNKLAQGIPPYTGNTYTDVNHPYHSGGEWFGSLARAHDWLWDYPGYTDADKRAVAAYLLEVSRIMFELGHPNTGKPAMSWWGPGDAFGNSPGSESHHPWYYVLPLVGDRLVDETKIRQILATFETHWLNGAWLDVAHFESRGAGTKALGGYGAWYPLRLILNFHAWKTATGQDYFNTPTSISADPAYFRNYPSTYAALQKPQKPTHVLPLGQASGDDRMPADIMRMLTGVLTGQPARFAAYLGGEPTFGTPGNSGLPMFLTYDPTVVPERPPDGVTFFRTYGLVVDRRSDGTMITLGAPPMRLKGHTWATKGGGPRSGVPLGVTLQVRGVPVLVKHVGAHRGANKAFGQNAVRFYDPRVSRSEIEAWTDGGFGGTAVKANRVQDISAADDHGGIKTWTGGSPSRAVATLTRWYDPSRVSSYVRTYEWGPNFLRVIDEIVTTRPDIEVWSRWYTGHQPILQGVPAATGITERAAPGVIGLGPVTWTLAQKPSATLHVAGGPGFEWIDDLGQKYAEPKDMEMLASEGALEIGAYTITLKAVGSGRWEHVFTW